MSEKVLIYAGLTISKEEVLALVPDAIVKGPAEVVDILTDVIRLDPTHLILIDGKFHQSLPPWHKELVYCLMHPSLQGRVYGCSSMGALRAADLAVHGMIGYGEIFRWYNEDLVSDESEVAVAFHLDKDGNPVQDTVALVDARATLEKLPEEIRGELLKAAKRIHWTVRTPAALTKAWAKVLQVEADGVIAFENQKKADAVGLLNNFRSLPVPGPQGIGPESLSELFLAQMERERRITVDGKEIALEDIDAHMVLNNPYGRRIIEDATNRAVALMMCDQLQIQATPEEQNLEMAEFCVLNNIPDLDNLTAWREANGVADYEMTILMWQRARIKKLHRMVKTSRGYRKSTYDVVTYLWNCDRASGIMRAAIEGQKDPGEIDDAPIGDKLKAHCESKGIPLCGDAAQFALDMGFGNIADLSVALARYCQESS